jgi:hypothetical protein
MDMVMGNEHTSRPVIVLDLNADGPLSLTLSPADRDITTLAPTPSQTPAASDVEESEPTPFSTGRKIKGRKNAKTEANDNTMEIFREQFDELKISRERQIRQTDELLLCMKTLVDHIVTKE